MNKLKTLSIAICCLVSALWSEAQCMQEGNAIENVVGNVRHAADFNIGEAIAMLRSEMDQIRQDNLDLRDQLNRVQNVNTDPGRAKAWVNFRNDGTINESYNVTNVVFNQSQPESTNYGGGDYTVNFTIPFSSTNYCCIGTAATTSYGIVTVFQDPRLLTTSSARFSVVNNLFLRCPVDFVNIVFFGEQ